MPREYSFSDRLRMSQGIAAGSDVAAILVGAIPGAVAAYPAHPSNDRNGTDYWVEHARGTHFSVDVKRRAEDWTAKAEPSDDLALEIWSVMEKQKVGWTRDATKRTDYVLWLWQDTGRWCLMPFAMLCAVFQEHWQAWTARYPTHEQFTPEFGGYHSQCVFVPREVVWEALYRRFGGLPQQLAQPQ